MDSSDRAWLQNWTAAELQSKQEADPNLRKILLWKRNRPAQPAQGEVQGTSKATKILWAQWNRLLLENSVLYRQWQTENGRGTRLRLVLPRSLVPDILSALHDAPSAGHLVVTKTVEQVRERFYWYGLQHDVEDWCRQCEKCARRKSPQATARAPLLAAALVIHSKDLHSTSWDQCQ